MDLMKEGGSTSRPHLLYRTNYGYWKARMHAFIKLIDEKAWRSVLYGWKSSTKTNVGGKTIPKDEVDWTLSEYAFFHLKLTGSECNHQRC